MNIRKSQIANRKSRAFTLIELLVVIGILVLLIGILLPAVSIAYRKAVITRQKADFQSIAVALDAYKADFSGSYPPVDVDSTGGAVLGKALFGLGDATHFYDRGNVSPDDIGNPSYNLGTNPKANDALDNPPAAYSSATTYRAGDIILDNAKPTFAQYTQGAFTNIYVSLRDDNLNTFSTPDQPRWWASFNPYDGKDGPGFRSQFSSLPGGATGLPHAPGGKVYGPYLRPEDYHLSGSILLDRFGSPILYFPLQTRASAVSPNGLVAKGTVPAARPLVNVYNGLAYFCQSYTELADTDGTGFARVAITLGDYNVNGQIDSSINEPAFPNLNFLLWSGGPDKTFGPAGTSPGTGTIHDFDKTGADVEQNRRASAACDDITNFR